MADKLNINADLIMDGESVGSVNLAYDILKNQAMKVILPETIELQLDAATVLVFQRKEDLDRWLIIEKAPVEPWSYSEYNKSPKGYYTASTETIPILYVYSHSVFRMDIQNDDRHIRPHIYNVLKKRVLQDDKVS